MIGNRSTLTKQPSYPAQINWGNPITKGLVFAVSLNCFLPLDLVSGKLPTLTGGASIVPTKESFGLSCQCVSGSLDYGKTGADSITTQGTIIYMGRADTYPVSLATVFTSDESTYGDGFSLSLDNQYSINQGFIASSNNGTQFITSGSNVVSSLTKTTIFAFTWNATTSRFFVNGVQVSQAGSFSCNSNSNRTTKLTARGVSTFTQNHRDSLFLLFNRVLSVDEVSSLSKMLSSPWQVLQYTHSPYFVTMSSGVVVPSYIMQYWS